MAKVVSFYQEGKVLDWVNNTGANIEYLDIIVFCGRVYIAAENIADGATGSIQAVGVWEFPAVNNQVFNVGDKVYYGVSAGKVTKIFGGADGTNIPTGEVVEAKALTGTTAYVDISKAVFPVSLIQVVGPGEGYSKDDVISLVGGIAIALEDIDENAIGVAAITGIFTLAAETDTAFTKGDKLYWDPDAGELTKTETDSTIPAGIAAADKLQATATASICINVIDDNIETIDIADSAVTNAKLANIARGSIKIGGAADAPTDLDAKGDGKILIGDGTDVKSLAVSGDITITNAGVTAIGAGKVTAAMLANGAGLAALAAAGLGKSAAYTKAADGVQTLFTQDATARTVLIIAVVTEAFADGDGGQTVFTIGEADSATKYAAGAKFTDAALGSVFVLAGSLTASKDLIVTGTPATGTGTGALSVTALILPEAV